MGAYVYYSYEEWGRGYIGARSRSPVGDEYLGSYTDTTFNPTEKIVLCECDTMEEALSIEKQLHHFFDVVNNSHFANRAMVSSSAFIREWTDEQRQEKREQMVARNTSDEHKQNMRENNPMFREEVRLKCVGNKSRTGMTNTEESNEKRRKTVGQSKWVNDGTGSRRLKPGEEKPEGWEWGRHFSRRRRKRG